VLKCGSGCELELSENGDVKVGYKLSTAFKFKPKLVRSVPRARTFISCSIRTRLDRPLEGKELERGSERETG
jgi:hypothetical protein